MPRAAKQLELTRLIRDRISHGYYLDDPIPSERVLAAESGVSYETARKAIKQLLKDKTLDKLPNGRLAVASEVMPQKVSQYVLVAPAFDNPYITHVRFSLECAISPYNGILKVCGFRQPSDPALMSVFDGNWDGIFIIPPLEGVHRLLMDRIVANRHRVISLVDMIEDGIASVLTFRAQWGEAVVDHLVQQGHRRVDCLNTQPGPQAKQRIEAWQRGIQKHGIEGRLWDKPVPNFQYNWVQAYQVARDALQANEMASAVYCTNVVISRGLSRAAHELGLERGKDIHYATVDGMEEAVFEVPSVTTLDLPSYETHLNDALKWLHDQDRSYEVDALSMVQRHQPDLLLGESTGFASNVMKQIPQSLNNQDALKQ